MRDRSAELCFRGHFVCVARKGSFRRASFGHKKEEQRRRSMSDRTLWEWGTRRRQGPPFLRDAPFVKLEETVRTALFAGHPELYAPLPGILSCGTRKDDKDTLSYGTRTRRGLCMRPLSLDTISCGTRKRRESCTRLLSQDALSHGTRQRR